MAIIDKFNEMNAYHDISVNKWPQIGNFSYGLKILFHSIFNSLAIIINYKTTVSRSTHPPQRPELNETESFKIPNQVLCFIYSYIHLVTRVHLLYFISLIQKISIFIAFYLQ